MTFSEKLRQLLNFRRLNLHDLSEATGLSYHTLRSYLSPQGNRAPTAPNGILIARSLGVPAEWLFDDDFGWPPNTIELQSVGDGEFLNELRRRRMAWLKKRAPVIGAMANIDRTLAAQWCKQYENQAKVPVKIERGLLCEWISRNLEVEYDLWFSSYGDPFDPVVSEQLNVVNDWLNRPACPRSVLQRAERHVIRLGNRTHPRIRELLPDVYAALWPKKHTERKKTKG